MADVLTVHQALAAVMAELGPIGKDGRAAPQQGGYAYRGIEQITQRCQGLFAEHGVVVVPHVDAMDVREITVQNKPWTDTTLTVTYRIFGPDGSSVEACTVGIGRDNSDKGANKAMTQAFKYLLLQLLCISDAADDTDGTHHEADYYIDPHEEELRRRVATVTDQIKALDDADKAELAAWKEDRSLSEKALHDYPAWLEAVERWLVTDRHNTDQPELTEAAP